MTHKICPVCGGTLKHLSATATFCLDCDWDTLAPLSDASRVIAVDAAWYMKTQLRKYRRWTDRDFAVVLPDWSSAGWYTKYRNGYATQYFYRDTVSAHEETVEFQRQLALPGKSTRQRLVPEPEKIHTLAWTACVRGEELFENGWTREMVDRLPAYSWHKWRRKRLFRLGDLLTVSQTFFIGDQTVETPTRGQRNYRNYSY